MEVVKANRELNNNIERNRRICNAVILSAICLVLIYISTWNFTLFHTLTEIFCILIVLVVAVIAFNSFSITKKSYFFYISATSFFAGIFLLLHILTFDTGNIFPSSDVNTSVKFSTVFKYYECLVFIASYISYKYKISTRKFTCFFAVLTVGVIYLILFTGFFPDFTNEELEPTLFKVFAEYFGLALGIFVFLLFIIKRKALPQLVSKFIIVYFSLATSAKILFTVYGNVLDIYNALGHLLRFLSFYVLFEFVLEAGFKRPVEVLFNKLEETNTELENKTVELQNANEKLKNEIEKCIQAKELLKKSEESYRLIFEFIPDAIIVHDDYGIIFSNQAGVKLCEVLDLKPQAGSSPCDFLHMVNKNDFEKCSVNLINDDKNLLTFEKSIALKDGSSIELEIKTIPYYFEDKPAYLSVVRDITQRRQVEELKKSFDHNTRLLQEAVEIDKIKTDFFTDLSHEIRTPINIILCVIQLMERGLKENNGLLEDRDKSKKYISTLKQNSMKLLRIVNNILDISKINSGSFELRLKNCDIVKAVEDVVLSVYEYTKNRDLCLMFDSEVDKKIIACDVEKIERIVLNLLSNAIKYTKRGGRIEVCIYEKEENIVIMVRDTGVGIPEDKKDMIFERFKRADNSSVSDCESTGIGLSLVKSLVEMHGGNIWVESKVGEGSTFYVELPVKVLPEKDVDDSEKSACDSGNIDRISLELSDII
ncbi:MAG TPA: MASE3 domain-containing protein [Acetivibrio sp.]|nr:MASE3 domain-containing protein [Acetivibrio sp.]HQA57720.1 MASE3 domain-containing protein [Acetivibrio sp.]